MIYRVMMVSLALLAPAMAGAGELSDVIFRPGALSATAPVRYAHERSGPEVPDLRLVAGGELIVTPEDGDKGRMLVLTHAEEGRTTPVASFSATGGDPVLLYFLENTVRSMAAVTAGSPFYIRNRMREALGQAGLETADGPVTAELTPFAEDPNRDKMGDFADLVLRITVDAGEPVPLTALVAETGGAVPYRETLILESK